jgi:hypothetical protein
MLGGVSGAAAAGAALAARNALNARQLPEKGHLRFNCSLFVGKFQINKRDAKNGRNSPRDDAQPSVSCFKQQGGCSSEPSAASNTFK